MTTASVEDTFNRRFEAACKADDLATVVELLQEQPQRLLEAGPDLLMDAVLEGAVRITAHLLDCGIGPDDRLPDGSSALHGAPFFGKSGQMNEAGLLLLERGADVNLTSKSDTAPLYMGAMLSNWSWCLVLIGSGARMTPDMEGQRAHMPEQVLRALELPRVHAAAASGVPQVLLRALEEGADPLERAADGSTVADTCRAYGCESMAQIHASWVARALARQACDLEMPRTEP